MLWKLCIPSFPCCLLVIAHVKLFFIIEAIVKCDEKDIMHTDETERERERESSKESLHLVKHNRGKQPSFSESGQSLGMRKL